MYEQITISLHPIEFLTTSYVVLMLLCPPTETVAACLLLRKQIKLKVKLIHLTRQYSSLNNSISPSPICNKAAVEMSIVSSSRWEHVVVMALIVPLNDSVCLSLSRKINGASANERP